MCKFMAIKDSLTAWFHNGEGEKNSINLQLYGHQLDTKTVTSCCYLGKLYVSSHFFKSHFALRISIADVLIDSYQIYRLVYATLR